MQKMSKAEAGKLGALKSKESNKLAKDKRIKFYMTNPKLCHNCNKILMYENKNKKFCNSSCAAIFNNKKRRILESWYCLNCKKEHKSPVYKIGTYCSVQCQKDHEWKQRILLIFEGKGTKGTIKRYLLEQGHVCNKCKLTKWNNLPIPLELEHIDGNSNNNKLENVELLCPNCHAQTPTYKSKNKGNGRHYRRIRYKEGKSY